MSKSNYEGLQYHFSQYLFLHYTGRFSREIDDGSETRFLTSRTSSHTNLKFGQFSRAPANLAANGLSRVSRRFRPLGDSHHIILVRSHTIRTIVPTYLHTYNIMDMATLKQLGVQVCIYINQLWY